MNERSLIVALSNLVRGDVITMDAAQNLIDEAINQIVIKRGIQYHLHQYMRERLEDRGLRRIRSA